MCVLNEWLIISRYRVKFLHRILYTKYHVLFLFVIWLVMSQNIPSILFSQLCALRLSRNDHEAITFIK